MRRRFRVLIVAAGVASCALAIVGLSRASAGSEGPLTSMLSGMGARLASTEHALVSRFRGDDRARRLSWYADLRTSAPRLRKPTRILLGAYDSRIPGTLDGIGQLESQLATTLPLIQIYTAFGDKPEQQFPGQIAQAIRDAGSTPLITWEPWLGDFESARHPNLPLREQRDRHGLAAVAAGAYDDYIDGWARDAATFASPVMVRLGHEMNDPYRYPWGPQNNTKEEYIAFWQHVVQRFRKAGATNVVWVWSPHVAYEYWDLYYPGDSYVDWVATGALNFGPIAQWSRWWTFSEIFGQKYPKLASFGKPVMVAEFGSLAVGGDRAAWYRAALAGLPAKYPAVKALLFFNARDDQTLTYQKVDWTIATDSLTASAIRDAIRPWDPGHLK